MIISNVIIGIVIGFIAAVAITAFVNGKPISILSEFYGLLFQLGVSAVLSVYVVYDIQNIECVVIS